MTRNTPMSKTDRTAAKVRLSRMMREWIKMTDEQLLAETRKEFPLIAEATREECFLSLVTWWVEKLFNTY